MVWVDYATIDFFPKVCYNNRNILFGGVKKWKVPCQFGLLF